MFFEAIVDETRCMSHDTQHTTDDGHPTITIAHHELIAQMSIILIKHMFGC